MVAVAKCRWDGPIPTRLFSLVVHRNIWNGDGFIGEIGIETHAKCPLCAFDANVNVAVSKADADECHSAIVSLIINDIYGQIASPHDPPS